MTGELLQRVGGLLAEAGTIATIATIDEHGAPQSVPTPFLQLDEAGRFVHLELLETSSTHRNLLGSIWFDRPVSVTLSGRNDEVLVISGRVYKALVSGLRFSRFYRKVRSQLGDADLAAVWLIEPLKIHDETYQVRKAQEETFHPFYFHLDRLVIRRDSI